MKILLFLLLSFSVQANEIIKTKESKFLKPTKARLAKYMRVVCEYKDATPSEWIVTKHATLISNWFLEGDVCVVEFK